MCVLWWTDGYRHRFFSSTSVFLCHYNSVIVLYSSSSTRCSYRKDKRLRLGDVTKSNVLSEIGGGGVEGRWIDKYFHLGFKGLIPKKPSPQVLRYLT